MYFLMFLPTGIRLNAGAKEKLLKLAYNYQSYRKNKHDTVLLFILQVATAYLCFYLILCCVFMAVCLSVFGSLCFYGFFNLN